MQPKGQDRKFEEGAMSRWLWIAVMVLFTLLMFMTYRSLRLEGWGLMLVLIYATNLLFATLTLRSLKQLRISRDLLRLRAEEMEEKRAKEAALLSSLGEGIVVTNKNGDVEMINQQAGRMIGWSQEEVVGKKWYEVAPLQNEKG